MGDALQTLQEIYPLPPGWKAPELYQSHVIIGGTRLERVGLVSYDMKNQMVSGSAVEMENVPLRRAYFELLERLSIVEAESSAAASYPMQDEHGRFLGSLKAGEVFPQSTAPQEWRYARSNGVASQVTLKEACAAAKRELQERDRILRSWYGEITPQPVSVPANLVDIGLATEYTFRAYRFSAVNEDLVVTGVFAYPIKGAVRAYGFGSRPTEMESVECAMRECLQSMGFLYGETISEDEPAFSPSPTYHLEYYLRPLAMDRIRGWLEGKHSKFHVSKEPEETRERRIGYVDITPPTLTNKIYVVKAFDPAALPLVFGKCGHLSPQGFPEDLWIHPIA